MSAAVYTITKNGATLDLLAGHYLMAGELPIGTVPRSFTVLGGLGVDKPSIGAYSTADARVLPFACEVTGDTGQGLEDNLDALYAVLPGEGETATITLGRSGGAYTGTITVLAVSDVECIYGLARDVGHGAVVTCQLHCEPWVYSAAETLYSAAAVTIPAAIDLSAMTGDARTPLGVLLDATTANLHQVVAGVYPEVAALTKFVVEAATLTWAGDGDAAEADANGYPDGVGNTLWKTNAAAGCYTDLDVTDFLGGTYALYANDKRDAGASPATIETPYGAPVTIEGTDLRRQLIGLVSLPCAVVRGTASSTLRVTLKGDGTDYAYVNTIEIVPVSWGAVSWHHGTAASSCDELRLEDGIVYADNVASPVYVTLGNELRALGGTLVITGEGTAEAPTLDVAATVTHEPRWEQFPSL